MTTQSTLSPKRRRMPFSSVGAKITLILLALGAASAAIGILVTLVFDRVATDMDTLAQNKLPQLELSSSLIEAASQTKDAMAVVLLATGADQLATGAENIAAATAQLNESIALLPEEARGGFEEDAQNAASTLEALVVARKNAFRNKASIEARTAVLQQLSGRLQATLAELAAESYSSLKTRGEETMSSIDDTLIDLVENQFAMLQSLLEARSEVNLLSGTTLAIGTAREDAMRSTLKDIALASLGRLSEIIETVKANGSIELNMEAINMSVDTFQAAIGSGMYQTDADRQEVLRARIRINTELSTAVEDMVFVLSIAAEDAGIENREAIQGLLDNDVSFLNKLVEINSWISSFQVAALDVVVAPGIAETTAAAEKLQQAAKALKDYTDFNDGSLEGDLSVMIALASPKKGVPAFKTASLEADATAAKAATDTAEAVRQISQHATALGSASLVEIAAMAKEVSGDISVAQEQMQLALIASGVVLVLAMILTRVLVQRPLVKISATTERLAEGHLSPVSGFDRASEEIYRIARALSVFRDGLVEKEEMSKAVEAERQERMAEQEAAVSAIGSGLERLSKGDLTVRIDDDMSEGYAKLRDDFNQALDTLKTTVFEVVSASESIRNGATEISHSSDDLSRRTESQAATLEQTAAALDEMTASVKSAAKGATRVETIMAEAKTEAEESGYVVKNAVSAMTEIEDSARHISQIIGVIDDISFQTNLLALNAGVEAARAGEAGRGFAVVASEVRGLAQRSSDAAMEIKTLISDSSKQVEKGVDLVGKAGDALTSIFDRVNNISQMVSEIAVGAAEQSTGLNEINIGVTQLDQVTQQNAAMVEEATAASHLLNTDANKLSSLVAHFSIDTGALSQVSYDPEQAKEAPTPNAHFDSWDTPDIEMEPVKVSGGGDDIWQNF
ncbi:methyl-accepting chemotaxis protein [Parasedimentitalea maritima]|nr:methyl-accepting chemotaxis protein [Zongyanglinia marina]